MDTAVDFLATKSQEVDRNRNAKIDQAQYDLLTQQFATDKTSKDKAETLIQKKREEKEAIQAEREQKKPEVIRATATLSGPKVAGKIDLSPKKPAAPAVVEAPVFVAPEPVRIQSGGQRGRKASLRTLTKYELSDYAAALAHVREHPDVVAAVEKVAFAQARAGATVPGVRSYEEKVAV